VLLRLLRSPRSWRAKQRPANQLKAVGVETHLVLLEGAGHMFAPDDRYNMERRRVLEAVMRRLLAP